MGDFSNLFAFIWQLDKWPFNVIQEVRTAKKKFQERLRQVATSYVYK